MYRSDHEERQISKLLVKVYAQAKCLGFRDGEASILALAAKTGKPCVIGDIHSTSLGGIESSSVSDAALKPLCYNMEWKPDLDLMSNKQIESYCSKGFPNLVPKSTLQGEQKQLICYLALMKAMDASVTQGHSQPHLNQYVDWMKLEISTCSPENLAYAQTELTKGEEHMSDLMDNLERSNVDGALIVRVAKNLTRIITGEIDVLDLLFHDNIMDEYYNWTHNDTSSFRKLELYIDALVHKTPNLNFLEIGAGTGGATELILQSLVRKESDCLPRCGEYVFTDISPSFLEKAKHRFKDYLDRMKFSALNIEDAPLQQGFEEHRYDVIIASNASNFRSRSDLTCLADILPFLGVACNCQSRRHFEKYPKVAETVSCTE